MTRMIFVAPSCVSRSTNSHSRDRNNKDHSVLAGVSTEDMFIQGQGPNDQVLILFVYQPP